MRKPVQRPTPSADRTLVPLAKVPKVVKPTYFSPSQSCGEDEASHDRNIKVLRTMFKVQNPDPTCVEDLMRRTFQIRRSNLLDDSRMYCVESLFNTYPFLRQESEIIKEFDRIEQGQGKSFLLCKLAWLDCVPKILVVAQKETGPHIRHSAQQLDDSTCEGTQSLLGAIIASYFLVEARSKSDHSRVLTIIPANGDIEQAAAEGGNFQARIVAVGSVGGGIKSAYMVLERKVLF